ncbi:MAG: hypothetical protein IKF11_00145 [Methanobrevibacter sp.]|nr:hypothetical protein [Methanobrevibacter sp.]
MKKSIKSTVILNKINLNGFLDLNSKSDFDKVMEVLNKLMVENNDEQ